MTEMIMSMLEEEVSLQMKDICDRVSAELESPPADPNVFESDLEYFRRQVEQFYRATHDVLNLHGFAVTHSCDPYSTPGAAEGLLAHFVANGGARWFADQYAAGRI